MLLIQDFREDGFLDVGWRYAYADGVLGIWGVFLNLWTFSIVWVRGLEVFRRIIPGELGADGVGSRQWVWIDYLRRRHII